MTPQVQRWGWKALAIALGTVAIVATVFQSITSRFIERANGCGFDGAYYCAMVRGHLAPLPWNQSVLLPVLVRLLTVGTVLNRFLAIDIISICICLALTFLLVRELGGGNWAALAASALVSLNPWTWHFTFSYPANTDELSLAAGMAWLLGALRVKWWALPLIAAAVLVRGQWALPIALATTVIMLRSRPRPVRWAMCSFTVLIAAGLLAVLQPHTPGPGATGGLVSTVLYWSHENFRVFHGTALWLWFALVGLGLTTVTLLVYLRTFVTKLPALVTISAALGHVIMATFFGGDTNRLLLPAFVLLSAVAFAYADNRTGPALLAVASGGTILFWRPWQVIKPDDAHFIAGWGQRAAAWPVDRSQMVDDVQLLIAPLTLMILIAVWAIHAQRTTYGPSTTRCG